MTIVIKDSTLVEWKETAMLRDEFYEELRTIQLVNVELPTDPVGLIGTGPISSSVEWIHLERVNASRLLSLVDDQWRGLLFFDCMDCGLELFPTVLYKMPRLIMAYMTTNNFTSIPDDWTTSSQIQLQMLTLDGNPQLHALPDSLWRQAATCSVFSMSWTNLTAVMEWIADVAGRDFLLTAIGTPLCTNVASLAPRIQELVVCS